MRPGGLVRVRGPVEVWPAESARDAAGDQMRRVELVDC